MKKRARKKVHASFRHNQISWLPVDSRLIPDIISFGHVKGIARFFLMLEIILAVLIVISTLSLAIVKLVS